VAGRIVASGSGSIADVVEKHFDPVFANTLVLNSVLWNLLPKEPCKGKIYWKARYAGNTSAASYGETDTTATAGYQAFEEAVLDPKYVKVEIQITGPAQAISDAGGALIDVLKDEMEGGMNDLVDEMNTQLYGDGTGNSSKDLTGLAAGVDDATNVATYANLARGTYAWWKALYMGNDGDARPLTLDLMKDTFRLQRKNGGKLDLILTNPDHSSQYEDLLTPVAQNRYQVQEGGKVGEGVGAGATNLFFKGVPIVDDNGCPEGKMYFLDRRWIKYRILKQFSVKEMGATTDATQLWLRHYGNLQVKDPKKQAQIADLSPAQAT